MQDPSFRDETTERLSALLSFLAVNLLWIFFALWLIYGMAAVLLFALVVNHMISRLEIRLLREKTLLE